MSCCAAFIWVFIRANGSDVLVNALFDVCHELTAMILACDPSKLCSMRLRSKDHQSRESAFMYLASELCTVATGGREGPFRASAPRYLFVYWPVTASGDKMQCISSVPDEIMCIGVVC